MNPSRTAVGLKVVALGCLFFANALAHADLLGSTLSWQYYAYGGPYTSSGQTSGTFVDNGGVGGTFIGQTSELYFNIVADDTSIALDYSITTGSGQWSPSPLSLAPTIYNGIAINMVSGPAFNSVTIDPASNMAGFDATRLSFTSSQIQVDWQNLSFSPSTIVKLDINAIPEPATWSLLALGVLTLLGGCRMRRRS